MKSIEVGMIRGRHELPVDEYILDNVEDVTNVKEIRKNILEFIENNIEIKVTTGIGIQQASSESVQVYRGDVKLVVYVTGLTIVTAELIRICMLNGIELTLMHFDANTSNYFSQTIL